MIKFKKRLCKTRDKRQIDGNQRQGEESRPRGNAHILFPLVSVFTPPSVILSMSFSQSVSLIYSPLEPLLTFYLASARLSSVLCGFAPKLMFPVCRVTLYWPTLRCPSLTPLTETEAVICSLGSKTSGV